MLFLLKLIDDFYVRKVKRALFAGWSIAFFFKIKHTRLHNYETGKITSSVNSQNAYCCEIERWVLCQKSKTQALRRSIHCVFASRRNKRISREKKLLHDPITYKMLLAQKLSDDFYTTKAKGTLYPGWPIVFSKADEISWL